MVALITVVSLLFAASQAAALSPLETIQSLAKRQSSSVPNIDPSEFPAACQSGCTSAVDAVSACTSMACVCTSSNLSGIQSCITCIVNSDPADAASLQSVGQNVIDTYNSECAGQGGKSLTLGSATGTSSPSSSTGSSSGGSSASKLGAAGKVGIPMMGVFGAGVVGGIAAFL